MSADKDTTKEALEPQPPERIAARICRCGVIALGTNACPHCGAGWAQVKVPLTTFYRVPAPIAPVVDERSLDARLDRAYIAGAKFGWNRAEEGAAEGAAGLDQFQAAIRGRYDDIHTAPAATVAPQQSDDARVDKS